jgi:hypothetical protein
MEIRIDLGERARRESERMRAAAKVHHPSVVTVSGDGFVTGIAEHDHATVCFFHPAQVAAAQQLLKRVAMRLWEKACDLDGIERTAKFVVFSKGNPYGDAQGIVLDARSRVNAKL